MTFQDQTKARLLEAAGEEFAARGFDCTRIRDICTRAKANVAAVNYHFGDKEHLYQAAVMEAHRCGTEMLPEHVFREDSPAEQLRRYIQHFLSNVIAMSRTRSWHQMLLLREMLQPTSALELVVREAIRPKFERLIGILRRARPEADERRLHALAFSIIGQCLHYKMASEVSRRLIGDEAYETLDLDYLSNHIATFSLAALGLAAPFGDGSPSEAGAVLSGHEWTEAGESR